MARNRSLSVKSTGLGSVDISGLDEVRDALSDLSKRDANNIVKAVLRSIIGRVRDEAKANVPTDTGNLRKSLKVEAKRAKSPDKPVFALTTGGKGSKYDGWYWRFVEYGTAASNKGASNQPARPFIQPAIQKVNAEMPSIIREDMLKKMVAAVKRKQKKSAKSAGDS